jgi:hypothetical protein
MTSNRKNNLTINIYADDQLRSSNTNNNTLHKIQSNSIQMLYPNDKPIPSVPICNQQRIGNDNVDRKIQGIFE